MAAGPRAILERLRRDCGEILFLHTPDEGSEDEALPVVEWKQKQLKALLERYQHALNYARGADYLPHGVWDVVSGFLSVLGAHESAEVAELALVAQNPDKIIFESTDKRILRLLYEYCGRTIPMCKQGTVEDIEADRRAMSPKN